MSRLELKIPPAVVMLVCGGLMWAVARRLPGLSVAGISIPQQLHFVLPKALLGLGALISIASLVSFSRARTTVDPTKPHASTSLVTSGVYRVSRNPIYLGMFLLLLAWGVKLSNLVSIALTAGFVLYMTRFQIRPEERALEERFGEAFIAYKRRVRRWL